MSLKTLVLMGWIGTIFSVCFLVQVIEPVLTPVCRFVPPELGNVCAGNPTVVPASFVVCGEQRHDGREEGKVCSSAGQCFAF